MLFLCAFTYMLFSCALGEYQFADGSQFRGTYENNKKNGLGSATYVKRELTEEGGNPSLGRHLTI